MIIQGKEPGTETLVNVFVERRILKSVEAVHGAAPFDFGGPGFFLCRGFFDPQVNGYAGIDFNGQDLNHEKLHQAALRLAASGVTRFFPTLITASHARLVQQLDTIADALEIDPLLNTMCPGIHLEGPYISPEEGPRGAHPRDWVRLPDLDEAERFHDASRGRVRCITLSPELEGAIPFIEKTAERGIVIGIGHTNASDEVLEDAYHAGAGLSTHLGNAASAVLPRLRNVIQKQLSMDGLMASIIADGVHLPDYVFKNYVRSKGIDRVLLTTDSMAGAAAPAGRYTLGDAEVEVHSDDMCARLLGGSRLAGSTLTMDRAVTNAIRFAGTGLAGAIRMAGENGKKLFPEIGGELLPGSHADLVLFEFTQGRVKIISTWIRGERIETVE